MKKLSLLWLAGIFTAAAAQAAGETGTYEVQRTVEFGRNSTEINRKSQTQLKSDASNLSTLLRYRPEASVEIAGYAEPSEKAAGVLADARAQKVWEFLISLGLPAERMEPVGYGDGGGDGRVEIRVAADDAVAMRDTYQQAPPSSYEPPVPLPVRPPVAVAAPTLAEPTPLPSEPKSLPPPAPRMQPPPETPPPPPALVTREPVRLPEPPASSAQPPPASPPPPPSVVTREPVRLPEPQAPSVQPPRTAQPPPATPPPPPVLVTREPVRVPGDYYQRPAPPTPPPARIDATTEKGTPIKDNQFAASYTRPLSAPPPKSALPGESSYFIQGTVYFSTNDRSITAESSAMLNSTARRLQKLLESNPQTRIDVVGHADPLTEAGQADVLAEGRADELAKALAERGVDRSRLHIAGAADQQPLTSKKGDPARELNRRAEIRVLN